MADVRSLLRQQRAARRIVHPHAAYSDAGKLLCTVCHEQVRAESLWESHVHGATHVSRAQKLQQSRPSGDQAAASHKRKLDDEDMDDVPMADEGEDGLRKKRSRIDVQESGPEHDTQINGSEKSHDDAKDASKTTPPRIQPPTPPLPRRTSGTPSHGVELRIPSRPATPVAVRSESSASNGANHTAALNRSPLRQHKEPASVAGFVLAPGTTTEASIAIVQIGTRLAPPQGNAVPSETPVDKGTQDVDEDEWAAFEADLLAPSVNGTSSRPAVETPADAVISAPAMTADEVAAKSAEEERERRRLTADIELSNEKEDATRALEEEFEDMEELEARVRRLKERREALRKHRGNPPVAPAVGSEQAEPSGVATLEGKGNAADAGESEGEDDDEDDEDEDDWAGFRFKG